VLPKQTRAERDAMYALPPMQLMEMVLQRERVRPGAMSGAPC